MNMKSLILIAVLMLSAIVTSSCFGSRAPQRVYYGVNYIYPELSQKDFLIDGTLVVNRFTTSLAYDRQELVYRLNPFEYKYYPYNLWASKPRKLINEIVIQDLKRRSIFREVSDMIATSLPNYTLDAEIIAMEELDASESEWYAHLAMAFTLKDYNTGKIIWTYQFDESKAVAERLPLFVVKAISELMTENFDKAFDDLERYMRGDESYRPLPDKSDAPQTLVPTLPDKTASDNRREQTKDSDKDKEVRTQEENKDALKQNDNAVARPKAKSFLKNAP